MRAIFTMAAKDLRLMSRDWLGMFFIIGFPIAMGVFFGTIMGSVGTEKASLAVAVVDEDHSPTSQTFVKELRASGNVQVETMECAAAIDKVRKGQLVGMIGLPKGFGDSAGFIGMKPPSIEVGVDPSHKAESGMLQGNIMQAMGKVMFSSFEDPAAMRPFLDRARKEFGDSSEISPAMRPVLVQLYGSLDALQKQWEEEKSRDKDKSVAAQKKRPEFNFVNIEKIDVTHTAERGSHEDLLHRIQSKWDISFPQAMMWGVLACSAGFAITIVRERKQGTFLRLQVAPVTRTQVVAGKATACFIAVVGVIVIMSLLGVWLGMRPRHLAYLMLAALCIAICFVGIMVVMSVIGKTEEAVSGAAWGANMFMAMFGGGMVPLMFMPGFMRTLSNISPVKWSIVALEGAIWRDFTLSEMLLPCGVLVALGVTCFAIGAGILSCATN